MTIAVVKGSENKHFCDIMFSGAITTEGSSDIKMQSCFGPSSDA